MPATASTAAAVDRRIARSILFAAGGREPPGTAASAVIVLPPADGRDGGPPGACRRCRAAGPGNHPPRVGSHRRGTGADCSSELCLLVGSAYRTEIGSGETGVGHGLLLHDRLGGIWEIASGANRPEPLPTELNQSL